jgi:hypothetical protein
LPEFCSGQFYQGGIYMGTFKDPVRCFAPIEVAERLLAIRAESGYAESIYLHNSNQLAVYLDAYGFDIYVFSNKEGEINYGDYRAPIVPGGDNVHGSLTTH